MKRVAEPVFVCRETAAALMQTSVDTWDLWVRDGFMPAPAIDRGQIKRWHWPTIERRLAAPAEAQDHDPFLQGLQHAKYSTARQRRAP